MAITSNRDAGASAGDKDEYARFALDIFAVEEELNLLSLGLRGVRFWELIRVNLFHTLAHRRGLTDIAHGPPGQLPFAHRIGWTLSSLVRHNPFFSSGDVLFWSGGRRISEDGFWDCRFCDPIMGGISAKSVAIETRGRLGHPTPTRTPNLRYLDAIESYVNVTSRLPGGFVLTRREDELLVTLERSLSDRFGAGVDLRRWVVTKMRYRQRRLPVYRRLLKEIRPKLVVLLVSYGKETFIEACRDLGIPVAELQHGVVGPFHPGYSFPGRTKKQQFPDYFLAFGDFWKAVTPFPIDPGNVLSVGYPYFDEQRKRYAGLRKRDQIVFLSQAAVGAKLSRMAVAFAQSQDGPLRVVYKLHPSEYASWRELYPWLNTSTIDVIDNHEIPLYRLLAESRAQVGCYSTAVVEGLGFELPTYLFATAGVTHLQPLLDRGLAHTVRTASELAKLLNGLNSNRSIATDDLFKPDALNNIRGWIKDQVEVR